MTKVPSWECRIDFVGDTNVTGRKQIMAPMWKKLMKNVDLEESTSFLDHENLAWDQHECKPNETIFEQYTKMFESRISAGLDEKYQDG